MSNDLENYALQMRKLELQRQTTLNNWLSSNDPELLLKAHMYLEDVDKRQSSGIKTIIFDPNKGAQSDGYLHKNTALSFSTLRMMSRTPIISSIIKTRVEQVSEFTTPQADRFQPGFIIRKKKTSYFSDEEVEENDKDLQKRIDTMVEFILNCGDNSNRWHGDTFDSLTRKIIPDSLALDQGIFEVVRNRRGVPTELLAVDGATMRIAESYDDDEVSKLNTKSINGYFPSYVQLIDGSVVNEYYPWELCFGIRNPSTSIYNAGYGNSELEELINVVTWMLNSDDYNGKFFSQGAAPKGIMKISGNVNPARLNEFRQSWQATTATVANAHKVPVIESDSWEWIDLQKNNRDMEFSQWQEYLIKVSCAMYKIDPREVFDLQHTNVGSLGGSDKEESIKYSRDKGLKPLLRAYQGWLNKFVVHPKDPELELVFVGLDSDSEERELDLDIKRGKAFMGLKEIRAKHGMGELDKDDIILSSEYLQYHQSKMEGSIDSNQYIDETYERELDYTEKSEDNNPFVEELNNFVKNTLMR